jgi:uncharacterized protein
MITTLTQTETLTLIKAPEGQLEMACADEIDESKKRWGIVCHPHPLMGGTMHNKVVTTLVKTFQGMGVNTVRFNFRGVGRSDGQFDHGQGEAADLLTVVRWVEQNYPLQELWLGGFSFGAYIATKVAISHPVKNLVTIAPPVENFSMQFLQPYADKWILVQGDLDDVVPADKVVAWGESRDPQPQIVRFSQAGHFFHGQLGELMR